MKDNSISININDLAKFGIDIESFLICYAKYYQLDLKEYFISFGDLPINKYRYLVDNGFLLRQADVISFETTRLNEKRFLNIINSESPSLWMDEWFDLWPRGIRSGGYYVRTDLVGCKKKMQSFVRKNKKYSKEVILAATKNYINRLRAEGYEYMSLAPNFIEKNNVSILAGECEAISDSNMSSEPKERSLFDTEIT